MNRLRQLRAVRWLLSLAVVALCAWAIYRLDWGKLEGFLSRARYGLVLIAAFIPLFHIWTKSERWRLLLSRIAPVPWLRLYHTLLLSFAASNILPARAGEVLRVYSLRKHYSVPHSSSVGVLLVEKVLEVAGLLIVVAPLPLVMPLPHWAKISILAISGIGAAAVVALLVVARFGSSRGNIIGKFAEGVRCIGSWQRLLAVVAWSVVTYLVDTVMITLVLRAYAIPCHWAAPALVLLAVNIAIALPSTPAQIGIFEAGAVAGLTSIGVPSELALAFAVTYHFVQIVPVLLVASLTGLDALAETRRQILVVAEPAADNDVANAA